jgi:arabinogalactan endo-1,4-beta-galactosidase
MNHIKRLTIIAALVLGLLSCKDEPVVVPEQEFWLGADIGWCTEYEQKGYKFYNKQGQERECTALMKELGLNAVRHRVWVDPSKHGNWCGKEDLLVKCRRADELGMAILLNFHYSDWWADPAKQNIPAAWSGHSYEQMKKDLAAHTVDILQYLKDNGIEPKWIQVGNETRNGFLWSVRSNEYGWPVVDENGNTEIIESVGHAVRNPQQYAGLFAAGYDACKSVFPAAIVMVHLDNGFDKDLYDWNLGILKKYGAKWDMIGMSLYPYWALDGGFRDDEEQTITDCIANIRHVSQKFNSDVMIVETGFYVDENDPARLEKGRRQLARVIRESINETGGRCKGVFYWEPECKPSQYKLGAFTEGGYPTVIMDAFRDWSE